MEYGLIGEKLGHSFSKEIHEMLGRYSYEIKEIPKDGVDAFMKAKDFKGINVTIPYKETVIPYLDEIDPAGKAIGAVNCVVNRNGKLSGFNTDFFGMKCLFEKNGIDPEGKKVLILGTGGTSKTATAVVKSMGAASVYKVSRHPEGDEISYEEACMVHDDANIIVNTTPAGMYPKEDARPIELASFRELEGVVDAIYNPLRTRLVLEAKQLGIRATGGLYMLVMQAIKAAEYFTGEPVDVSVGDEIYKKILGSKENIVLTGMPGAGKSTVGKLIAKELGISFYDTDEEIVNLEKREITEIFAKEGEAYFRDVEAKVIAEVSRRIPCVISTGGGAILRDDNVEALMKNGKVFYLDREPESITPTDDRPLADSKDKVLLLYKQRLPIYRMHCDAEIKVKGTPEALCGEILKKI